MPLSFQQNTKKCISEEKDTRQRVTPKNRIRFLSGAACLERHHKNIFSCLIPKDVPGHSKVETDASVRPLQTSPSRRMRISFFAALLMVLLFLWLQNDMSLVVREKH